MLAHRTGSKGDCYGNYKHIIAYPPKNVKGGFFYENSSGIYPGVNGYADGAVA